MKALKIVGIVLLSILALRGGFYLLIDGGTLQKKVYKIDGTVRDAAGKPISGAKFVLSPLHKPHGTEFMSEPDGTFKIRYTSDDVEHQDFPHYIFVWSPDDKLGGCIEIREDTSTRDVKLLPTVTLSGRLYDHHGRRISGVNIRVYFRTKNYSCRLDRGPVQTDALGRYVITGIPRGYVYRVDAESDDHGLGKIDVNLSYTKNVHIEMREPIFMDPKYYSVSGVVVDVNDKPVSEAVVLTRGFEGLTQPTRTSSTGEYTLEKIYKGHSFYVVAHAVVMGKIMTGWTTAEAGRDDVKIVVKTDNTIPKTLSVVSVQKTQADRFTITGVVRDETGNPMEGIGISIIPAGITDDIEGVYSSDSQGKFRMNCSKILWATPLPLQEIYLIAREPLHNLAVTKLINEDTRKVDVTLKKAAILVGRVVDIDGNPFSGAEIMLRLPTRKRNDIVPLSHDESGFASYKLKTSEKGEFEIKAIPYGHKYIISAEDDAFRSGEAVIDLRDSSAENIKNITIIAD